MNFSHTNTTQLGDQSALKCKLQSTNFVTEKKFKKVYAVKNLT